jgi:hypothetical protein
VMNAENGTFSPVAIFHSVDTVGLDSLRSICPSIALTRRSLPPALTGSSRVPGAVFSVLMQDVV